MEVLNTILSFTAGCWFTIIILAFFGAGRDE